MFIVRVSWKSDFFATYPNDLTGFICAQMVIMPCFDLSMVQCLYHFMNQYIMTKYRKENGRNRSSVLPTKEQPKVPIPLPLIAGQKCIVEKLEQLLPLCKRLKGE